MDVVDRLNELAARFGRCRDQDLCFDAAVEIRKLRSALNAARPFVKDDGYSDSAEQANALIDDALGQGTQTEK